MAPFFSVLVTAYNRERELARCIASCTQQTLDDFELVVVDDHSTDGTDAMLGRLDEPRLRVVRMPATRGSRPRGRAPSRRLRASGWWCSTRTGRWCRGRSPGSAS